jgi:hypothetical protein
VKDGMYSLQGNSWQRSNESKCMRQRARLEFISQPSRRNYFNLPQSLVSRQIGKVRPSTHMDGFGVYQACEIPMLHE